ncbi:MAG: hypothetical protein ACJ758_05415 [Actinomycetota bacterium]
MKASRAPESRLPVFPTAALAALAVVLGHQLVYRLAFPSATERATLLARTGHVYLPTTAHLVLLAALAAVGGLFLRSMSRRDLEAPGRSTTFLRLAAAQVSIFVLMEFAERIAAGAPVAGVATHGILFLGVAVQLLLAFGGAALVSLLHRAGAAAGERAVAPPHVRPTLVVTAPPSPFVRSERHHRAIPTRGPPPR